MADTTDVTTQTHWLAIDVAKHWHAVLIETASGARHRFKMANTEQDYERLIHFIDGLGGRCRAALEPTGDWHRPLAYRLIVAGVDLVSVSSVAQSRYREAKFNSWDKNDPKDAAVILDMLKQGIVQRYVDPMVAGHHDLQELSKTYFQISKLKTRIQHSILNHHVPLYFPEMARYWNSSRSEWWIRFMLEFTTPAHVKQLSREDFIAAAWSLIGKKSDKAGKLGEMWDTAHQSTALPHEVGSLAVETFRITLRQLQHLNETRADLERRAETILSDNADYKQLRTLPGVGPIIALMILAEAGDLRRFNHHRQFLKYCGLDLAKHQSGAMRGREQLSKRGNARLRLAFWMAGTIAVRLRENSFSDKYERYIRTAPGDADLKRKALTAVCAKMARVAYGLIKSNRSYQQFYEQSLPSGSIPLCRAVEASAQLKTS